MWNIFIKLFPIFMLNSNNLNKNDNIKGALFDLDGTLLDSQWIYDEATQIMINKYGNGEKYEWDVKILVYGAPIYESYNILQKRYDIKLTLKEYLDNREEFLKEPFKNVKLFPGVRELTHKLKYKNNVKIAIATSSPQKAFDEKTEKHKDWVKEDIDKIITGDDKRIKNGKPAPDIFILAANELNLKPEECIIFEDAMNGIQSAINAGAKVVVAIPEPYLKKKVEELTYDKNKTQLIILDSIKDFDMSLVK